MRTKCSAANICTGAPSASAVPIALLPTTPSDQSAPSVKPERVGAVADGGGALPPEQHAVGVGDDHDVPRVLGDRGQRGAELGQHALQRGAHAALLDLVGGERTGRVAEVGVDALRPRPHPRARDEPPRIGGRAVAGEQGVVDAREHPRVPDDVRARPDRADRLVHPHHPEPPD